jgi:hypothetical protein
MFEQEYRSQRQISQEAAKHYYAIMVAITARRADTKRVRRQRRAVRQTRSSAAEAA